MERKKNWWAIGIWGFALAVFYLTVGVVVAFVLLDQIALAINAHATLFDEWYQTLLFVLDIICLLGLGGSVTMYVITRRKLGASPAGGVFYKAFNRTMWGGISVSLAILMLIVYLGSSIALEYSAHLNSMLGINPFQKITVDDGDNPYIYFASDYYYSDGSFNDKAMREHSEQVSEEAASESTVLLWNKNSALPLAEHSKIGLFGVAQLTANYLFTGSGSGKLVPHLDKGLIDELELQNLKVYENLATAYRVNGNYGGFSVSASAAGVTDDKNYAEVRINEAPWSAINGTALGNVTDNTAEYEDAAIFLVSRNGGETVDLDFNNGATAAKTDNCLDDSYLDLSANEVTVLEGLQALKEQKKIKKIILLINSDNALQFKNLKNFDIDACMVVGMGGNSSFRQIANALTGKVTPSGKLVDTYVYDNDSAPAVENFGDFTFSEVGEGVPETAANTWNTKYLVYEEGIYVGYKYYETRYEDTVIGGRNADSAKGVKAGSGAWAYRDEVAYPFGYGISYTNFEYSNFKAEEKENTFEISVDVKNTGDVYSGKEAVQVYMQKPYTVYDKQKGIEKASVELVGFGKTKTLAPGATDTVNISVKKEEMRVYDSYGAKTYILEAGDYYLTAAANAHDAVNNMLAKKSYTVSNGMDAEGNADFVFKKTVTKDDFEIYSKSSATGNEITNRFDEADINLYKGTPDQSVTYLSRSDWDKTYPTPYSNFKCLNATMIADLQYGKDPEVREGDVLPQYGVISEKYGQMTLAMMMDVGYYEKEMWDAFMDQTTWEEQNFLVTYGSHVLGGAESVAAPGGLNQNGPSGLNRPNPRLGTYYAFPSEVNLACTYNTELVRRVGDAFGMEMLHTGYTSLNGLGADIHRTAYSGRNWEYYSEDGFMTGAMLGAESAGLMGRGIILFTKHCLMNDQERNRYGVTTWANEQTIREAHGKGFEMAIVNDGLNGIMSSFNRIGCIWTGRHEGLLTKLIRDEWGFTGTIETDAAVGAHMKDKVAMANAVVAGQDLWMQGGNPHSFDNYKDNPTVALAVREAARRILHSQLHANAMNGTGTNTRYVRITPWWENALDAAKVVITSLFALALIELAVAWVVNTNKFREACGDGDAEITVERADKTNAVSVKAAEANGETRQQEPVSGSGGGLAGLVKSIDIRKLAICATSLLLAVAVLVVSIVVPMNLFAPVEYDFGGGINAGNEKPPEGHECKRTCPKCGGCLDYDCRDEACGEKCGGEMAHTYVFEAENKKNFIINGAKKLSYGSKGDSFTGEPCSYVANFSANRGAKVQFNLYSETEQTVTLVPKISAGSKGAWLFTDRIVVSVNNGAELSRSTYVTKCVSTPKDFRNFREFNLGCVTLKAGENIVTLMATADASSNIDYLAVRANNPVKYSDQTDADIIKEGAVPVIPGTELISPDDGGDDDSEAAADTKYLYFVENKNEAF